MCVGSNSLFAPVSNTCGQVSSNRWLCGVNSRLRQRQCATIGAVESPDVPLEFKQSIRDYKEGIVITLSYPDGSKITLQQGGMVQGPRFHVNRIVTQSDTPDRLSRTEVDARSGTFSRLDIYKPKPPKGTSITWLELSRQTSGSMMFEASES